MAAIVANTNGRLAIPAPAGLLVLWKQHCFLCAAPCVMDKWHSDRCVEYRRAKTLEIRSKVLARCEERKDSWAHEVQSQLLVCCDLVAEEALYHRNCHRRFFHPHYVTKLVDPSISSRMLYLNSYAVGWWTANANY